MISWLYLRSINNKGRLLILSSTIYSHKLFLQFFLLSLFLLFLQLHCSIIERRWWCSGMAVELILRFHLAFYSSIVRRSWALDIWLLLSHWSVNIHLRLQWYWKRTWVFLLRNLLLPWNRIIWVCIKYFLNLSYIILYCIAHGIRFHTFSHVISFLNLILPQLYPRAFLFD